MAILNVGDMIDAGRPCRIYDATGKEWTKVLECDTQSGRIVRFVTDRKGLILFDQNWDPLQEEVQAQAPLRVEEVLEDPMPDFILVDPGLSS